MSSHKIEWHEERASIIRENLVKVRDKIDSLRNEEIRLSNMYSEYVKEISEAKQRGLSKFDRDLLR